MQHEIAMYAIAQKEGLGFDKAVETCKARMARYNVTPNMLYVLHTCPCRMHVCTALH